MNMQESSGFGDTNTVYSDHLSEGGLSVLRDMIGNRFYRVYAPCLQVAGAHLTAPSFSIPVFDRITGYWSNRYVVIQCNWFETPLTFTDYWHIHVSSEDKPDRIPVNFTGAIVAPCTINYFQVTPISGIEIYEVELSFGLDPARETVRYDNALRFVQESGKAFCIACQLNGPGIATDVHISDDDATIAQFLEGSQLRACFGSR